MLSFHSLMMSLSIMYLGSTFTSRIWRKRKGKRLGSKQSSLCYFFLLRSSVKYFFLEKKKFCYITREEE